LQDLLYGAVLNKIMCVILGITHFTIKITMNLLNLLITMTQKVKF
jgi:hypothetical protein